MPSLQEDSKGDMVVQLQTKLQSLGFGPDTFDGDFGPATKVAVIAFQQSANLSANGVAGPTPSAVAADERYAGANIKATEGLYYDGGK